MLRNFRGFLLTPSPTPQPRVPPRKAQDEGRSLARRPLEPYRSAMGLHHVFDDGQPQADPAG